jgi:ABC-type Zn uptake system ZnuABC Zn-binding protein ZnuA
MSYRRLAYLSLLLWLPASALLLSGCSKANDPWEGKGGPPRVVVSFPPLYSFVKSIGGDHVGVFCLCVTEDPHEFEYKPEQAVALRKADLLVGIGLDLDGSGPDSSKHGYTDKLLNGSGKSKLPFLKVGNALAEKKDGPEIKTDDPHIWLGIDTSQAALRLIAARLGEIDSGHKADYERNAKVLADRLADLEKEGRARLEGKKIVTSHDALGYFARSFKLTAIPIKENPQDSLDPGKVEKLARKILDENIRVIAVEPNNPAAKSDADRVTAEVNKQLDDGRKKDSKYKEGFKITTIEIDPLETVGKPEELTADWYIDRMKANVEELSKALQ